MITKEESEITNSAPNNFEVLCFPVLYASNIKSGMHESNYNIIDQ